MTEALTLDHELDIESYFRHLDKAAPARQENKYTFNALFPSYTSYFNHESYTTIPTTESYDYSLRTCHIAGAKPILVSEATGNYIYQQFPLESFTYPQASELLSACIELGINVYTQFNSPDSGIKQKLKNGFVALQHMPTVSAEPLEEKSASRRPGIFRNFFSNDRSTTIEIPAQEPLIYISANHLTPEPGLDFHFNEQHELVITPYIFYLGIKIFNNELLNLASHDPRYTIITTLFPSETIPAPITLTTDSIATFTEGPWKRSAPAIFLKEERPDYLFTYFEEKRVFYETQLAKLKEPVKETPVRPEGPEVLDFTEKDLFEIRSKLTELIKNGYVLHGSPTSGITELEPRRVLDLDLSGQPRERVAVLFADSPLMPLVRAGAYKEVAWWDAGFIFGLKSGVNKDEIGQDGELGFIYVVKKDEKIKPTEDSAEFETQENVKPEFVLVFKSEVVRELCMENKHVGDDQIKSMLLVIHHFLEMYSEKNNYALHRIAKNKTSMSNIIYNFEDELSPESINLLAKVHSLLTSIRGTVFVPGVEGDLSLLEEDYYDVEDILFNISRLPTK